MARLAIRATGDKSARDNTTVGERRVVILAKDGNVTHYAIEWTAYDVRAPRLQVWQYRQGLNTVVVYDSANVGTGKK